MNDHERAAHPITFSRRTALKTLGAAAVWPYLSTEAAAVFAEIQATRATAAPVFLTAAQYEVVDRLAESIIPADDHSPGAHEARVADYIDLLLAESPADMQKKWTDGLAALDAESRGRFQRPFAAAAPAQIDALLRDISANELAPATPLESFFVVTKEATIRGYYTSQIGIHQELTYKGNKFLREFVGCTHPEHGYETPKQSR